MILLFGFQAKTILANPIAIVLIAIPLLIQTYGIFAIAYYATRKIELPHNIAAPACMIATSNFFELAVAVAISLIGLQSGAALATVVGVLVEVPVMLSLVAFANRTHRVSLNRCEKAFTESAGAVKNLMQDMRTRPKESLLSDGSVAGVTAVNHEDLLNPQIILYNAKIPKEEASIIDLTEEEDLEIEETIRRNEVSGEILSYLNFGDAVNYFVDPSAES